MIIENFEIIKNYLNYYKIKKYLEILCNHFIHY